MRKRIGILGGGQLARMTTLAARSAGIETVIYDPEEHCCAASVANYSVSGDWTDIERVRCFASMVDVVTIDREDVPISTLAAASIAAEMYPSPEAMAVIRNKFSQKEWLRKNGFPTAPFSAIGDMQDLSLLPLPGFLKYQTGTFDGRGVVAVKSASDLRQAALGQQAYFEQRIDFTQEISVLVARSARGEMVAYTPAVNHHEDHILDSSVLGAELDDSIVREATALATDIAVKLRIVGLLVAEMFVTADGDLYINELAPRPHNSYHGSERAFNVSQFEQLTRVLSGARLEQPELIRPSAIVNLLGEAWANGEPSWEKALAIPGVKLHLYEKGAPRPGRKMGHLSAVAPTASQALELAIHARHRAITATKSAFTMKGTYEHATSCDTGA